MTLTSTFKRAAATLIPGSFGLAALAAAGTADAAVIGFDELAQNGNSFTSHVSVDAGGFNFVSNLGMNANYLVWGTTHNSNADQGGATLSHNYGGTTTTMSKIDGGTFSLLSIDFGDVYNQAYNIQTIQIVGTKSDLSTVTQTVTTDALIGLETFSFVNFVDLIAVEWTPLTGTGNKYLQLDNIVVDDPSPVPGVPEPMTLSLFGAGLAALALQRRRRR